jgi:hypothetical protein
MPVVMCSANLVRCFQLRCCDGYWKGARSKALRWGLFHAPSPLVRSGQRRIVRIIDGWPSTVTGLCPRVYQSGGKDFRVRSRRTDRSICAGHSSIEAAVQASSHPIYKDHYHRTKASLGRQPGAKVASIQVARKLAEAIWHRLSAGLSRSRYLLSDPPRISSQ